MTSPRSRSRLSLLSMVLSLCLVSIAQAQVFAVTRVVDGDTVVLESLGTVRLIGIDTPQTVDPREPVQAFGLEASAALRAMLTGKQVRIEYDQQRTDKYRRTLGYLYLLDGTFVNREMVRQGFAHAYLTYPFRFMDDFRAAEREAREAGRGLWGDAPRQSATGATPAPAQVWVNTGSGVYHCPGTRYYGNTARGEYMTETEAVSQGHRAANGRACGPITAGIAQPPASSSSRSLVRTEPEPPPARSANAEAQVWVNTSSKVYHCPGTRYYGKTSHGEYVAESLAKQRGNRPAYGNPCGSTPVLACIT